MTRRSPRPPQGLSNGSDPTRPVGHGNPPKSTQFKPGQSGNPRGRPKRVEDPGAEFRSHLTQALSRSHKVHDGKRTRRVSTSKLGVEQLARRFAKGDPRAIRDMIFLAEACGLRLSLLPAEAEGQVTKPQYDAILRRFVERIQKSAPETPERVLAPLGFLEDFSDDE